MSTQSRKLWCVFLSLVLHILVGMALFFLPSGPSTVERKQPVFVDVVALPPTVKPTEKRPEKPSAYSDRTVRVEKEKTPPEETVTRKRKKKTSGPPEKRAQRIRPLQEKVKPSPERKTTENRVATEKPAKEASKSSILKREEPSEKTIPLPSPPERRPEPPVALFPTEERLRELTERYRRMPPKREKGKVLSLNTSELKYSRYLLDMKQKIEFYWEYPLSSIRNGEQGRLLIDFVITRDGSVKDIRIVKSSNYPALDDAAVTAIRLASPFNPFPEDFTIEEVRVHASFEYQLIFIPYRYR